MNVTLTATCWPAQMAGSESNGASTILPQAMTFGRGGSSQLNSLLDNAQQKQPSSSVMGTFSTHFLNPFPYQSLSLFNNGYQHQQQQPQSFLTESTGNLGAQMIASKRECSENASASNHFFPTPAQFSWTTGSATNAAFNTYPTSYLGSASGGILGSSINATNELFIGEQQQNGFVGQAVSANKTSSSDKQGNNNSITTTNGSGGSNSSSSGVFDDTSGGGGSGAYGCSASSSSSSISPNTFLQGALQSALTSTPLQQQQPSSGNKQQRRLKASTNPSAEAPGNGNIAEKGGNGTGVKRNYLMMSDEKKPLPSFTTLATLSAQSSQASSPAVSSYFRNGPPAKKKPVPVPESQKDENYRKRRQKNNLSAKRSREQRRQKEEQTMSQKTLLEQENYYLRKENEYLRWQIRLFQASSAALGATGASVEPSTTAFIDKYYGGGGGAGGVGNNPIAAGAAGIAGTAFPFA